MSKSDSDSEDGVKKDVKESSDTDSSYEEEMIITIEEKKEVKDEKAKDEKAKDEETLVEVQPLQDNMSTPQPKPRRKRFIPKYEVEGVHKVILGEDTQIQIEMVVGTDINAQFPWKSVPKSKIVEAIEVGGELSEFFPLSEAINAYDDELVLIGYIVDESKDVDEFYVCCTTEARDHCKQQSDKFIRRQEKKLEKAVQKKPRPWACLGSDKEIISLRPVNARPLMEIELRTKFPKEYEPKKFVVRDTQMVRDGFIELTPYRQRYNLVFRRRVDCSCQASPATVQNHAQTVLKYPKNMWSQSMTDALGSNNETEAGGGGDTVKDIADEQEKESDEDDEEETDGKTPEENVELLAYNKAMKRMRRPSYIKMINSFMSSRAHEMKSIVELNTVMDIYCNDYPNLVAQKAVSIFDTMAFEEYVCFTDVRAKDKYVASAVFHPMWSGIVAISYADASPSVMKPVSCRPDPTIRAVYGLNPVMIWSHIDTLIPKLYLESTREVKVLSFCPFDENILIGGCINGQIVIWDLTNKLEQVEEVEVLSEKREKYKIAMNAHMGWMKNVQNKSIVAATAMSNLITSHYGAVMAIHWLSPNFSITPQGKSSMCPDKKKSLILFTGSEDGTILIWNLSTENVVLFEGKKVKKSKRVLKRPSGLLVDVSPFKVLDRNLQPCYKLVLGEAGIPRTLPLLSFSMVGLKIKYTYTPRNTGTGRKYFSCQILPQKENEISHVIYCGSQHGEVRKVVWEGHEFNTGEVVNSEYADKKFNLYIHDGAITCTKQNPFIQTLTLTVGGKIFALWSDDVKSKPLTWKKRSCRLTDGVWSLYKASLLFIATSEGNLETWDLLHRSDQPIAIQTLSGNMLTGLSLHTLPLPKNIIGVSDVNGSFKMFLNPPIFMIESSLYTTRFENMLSTELKVMNSFVAWQDEWMKHNPHILQEIKRKEGQLLVEKEEQKRKEREAEEKRIEEEAEARRLEKMRVIGPEERWQKIIQKLIERTIAVKKRIDRVKLIEEEKPLRELEAQRLEKERRMLEIMKNQKTIFNDTVAILFPEAIKKPPKVKKSLLSDNKETIKKEFLEDYEYLKRQAVTTVIENPYKVAFSWESTLAEGKERRVALSAHEDFIKLHRERFEEELKEGPPSNYKSIMKSMTSAVRESMTSSVHETMAPDIEEEPVPVTE